MRSMVGVPQSEEMTETTPNCRQPAGQASNGLAGWAKRVEGLRSGERAQQSLMESRGRRERPGQLYAARRLSLRVARGALSKCLGAVSRSSANRTTQNRK